MTTQEIIDYYANLLILEYVDQPKAYAHVQTVVTPAVMDQLPTNVQDGFQLGGVGGAVGPQLDILGKYAGVTRSGYGFGGPITLNDADFTSLIQVAIIRNNSGSSLADIQSLLHIFFPNQLYVFDGADMQMSYIMSSSVGSQDLAELFVTEGLLPKPMGVQLASLIYVPTVDLFGCRTYEAPAPLHTFPLNTYSSYNMSWPCLTYADAITI